VFTGPTDYNGGRSSYIFPNSAITELEIADSPEKTALSAKGLLTVRVSTPPSPLRPLALSFRQLMRFTPRSIADLGIFVPLDTKPRKK
ncbi:MAG: hypothetical protein ACE5FZ_08495, partial [Nitrospiria bacterium]